MLEQAQEDEKVINDIIECLPTESILPLLKVFQYHIQKRSSLEFRYGKCLRAFYHYHLPFLTTSKECMEILEVMNAIINAKTKSLNKIVELRSRIEMILWQAKENRQKCHSSEDDKKDLKLNLDESLSGLSGRLDEMLVKPIHNGNDEDLQWACEILFQKSNPSHKWIWTLID